MKEIWGNLKKLAPQEEREQRALIISGVSLITAFVVLLIAKLALGITSDVVIVSLLLLPTVAYMVISGKIEGLKAGVFETKFAQEANSTAYSDSENIEVYIEDPVVLYKGGKVDPEEILPALRNIPAKNPIILTLELGVPVYNKETILDYIKILSLLRNFKFVVFGRENKCEAYMAFRALETLVMTPNLGDKFIQTIRTGSSEDLFKYPAVLRAIVRPWQTNAEVLREMQMLNLDAILVIDEDYRVKSVIEREQVLSRIILAPTKPNQATR